VLVFVDFPAAESGLIPTVAESLANINLTNHSNGRATIKKVPAQRGHLAVGQTGYDRTLLRANRDSGDEGARGIARQIAQASEQAALTSTDFDHDQFRQLFLVPQSCTPVYLRLL
jgi:hypothetical protein